MGKVATEGTGKNFTANQSFLINIMHSDPAITWTKAG